MGGDSRCRNGQTSGGGEPQGRRTWNLMEGSGSHQYLSEAQRVTPCGKSDEMRWRGFCLAPCTSLGRTKAVAGLRNAAVYGGGFAKGSALSPGPYPSCARRNRGPDTIFRVDAF
ncbi:unnamed protein product, partial [Iphiclides podalirius]